MQTGSFACNVFGALTLVAYISTLIANRPVWEFAFASLAITAVSFVLEMDSGRRIVAYVWKTGVPVLVFYALVAYAGDVFVEFAISYVTSCLVLLWILLADVEQIVLYESNRAAFVFTRCGLYAILRAAVTFASLHWEWFTVPRAHLAIVLIPTVETIGMWLLGDRSYRYDRSPTLAVTYALLKTSVFVAIPLLDEFLYARTRE